MAGDGLETVIKVTAKSNVEGPRTQGDVVLGIERQFLDVGVPVVVVELPASRQVVWRQNRALGDSESGGTPSPESSPGSTIPKASFSVRNVCSYVAPILTL